MYFDHAFVGVPSAELAAQATERLVSAGLVAGRAVKHRGQGTQNTCFFFDQGYIELLWCHDEAEATSANTRRTQLFQRTQHTACPFGVSFARAGRSAKLPFRSWDYAPQYFPDGMTIQMAVISDAVDQPLVFSLPQPHRAGPDPRVGPHERSPFALRRVTVGVPTLDPAFEGFRDQSGVVVWDRPSDTNRMTVLLGPSQLGFSDATPPHVDLQDLGIPLVFRPAP
jgi:hypothetical protein